MVKGVGGVMIAIGLVATLLGGAGLLMAISDEQSNQGQEEECFVFCRGGPDEGRSEMNWGLAEAAVGSGATGLGLLAIGIIVAAMGGGVAREERHQMEMDEIRAGRQD